MRIRGRLTLIAGAIAFAAVVVFAIIVAPDALADRAADAEYRSRAAAVCPRPAEGRPSAPLGQPAPRALEAVTTGQVFISHGGAGKISILDLATGQVTTLSAEVGDPHEVAVSPDGRWGIAADFGDNLGNDRFNGRRLAVFDLAEKRLARVIDLGDYRGPHDVTFLPGSSTRAVVTTQTSQHVVEVDVTTGQVIGATETRAAGSHTMAIAADGRTAFTANEPEGTVSRIDLGRRAFVAKHSVGPAPAEGIAVTPDGRDVWVGLRTTGEVRVVNGENGALLATLTGFVIPDRIAMSPDGRHALITDFECEVVRVADVAGRRILGPIAGLEGAGVAKVLPDNRVAVVALLEEGAVALIDIEERRVLARHAIGRRLDAAAWGPTPTR